MRRAAFCTLGCKVNQYDTQSMIELMEKSGFETVSFDSVADVYIINTCTVTNVADRKSRKMIARAHSLNPDAVICVCGCLSQSAPEEVLDIEGVTCVAGTGDRSRIADIIMSAAIGKSDHVTEISTEYEDIGISKSGKRTRANIKVQEGCGNYCSYCIIPYVRGPERSRPASSVIREAERLAGNGVKEIVLGGIHVSSYKDAGECDLADLVSMLSGIDGIERIRLGSLEQPALSERFIEKLASSKKLCPHFHISLQSGSDNILRLMNRKYSSAQYSDTVRLLRQYFDDPAITTDVIVGFPGETDDDFNLSVDYAKEIGFSRMHVFPFSLRKGTKAETMTGRVPAEIKKQRTASLIKVGKKLETAYIDRWIGREADVLFEQFEEDGNASGYTERYIKVKGSGMPGEIKKVLLEERAGDIILTV